MSVPRRVRSVALPIALVALAGPASLSTQESPATNPDAEGYVVPDESIQRIFATDKNYAELDYVSPDGDHFLVPHETQLSTLALMSRPTYRLAELELRPGTDRTWRLDTYGIDGFRFYSLEDRAFVRVDLPEESFFSDFTWSPDGGRIAFLAHLPGGTEVWAADAASGRAARFAPGRVMATLATSARGQGDGASSMLQWTPQGSLLTLLVPSERGVEPARNPVPEGPVVRRTRDEAVSTRTYPFLLEDAHDADLFEFYTTAQLVEMTPEGDVRPLGQPRMYRSLSASPDGRHVLATFIHRPFSYITGYQGFPTTAAVLDREGAVVATLDEDGLREGGNWWERGSGDGPRAFAWRPGGGGLSFLERAPEDEDAGPDAPRPDRVKVATAPFDLEAAETLAESEHPIRSTAWSMDGEHLFGRVSRRGESGLAYWRVGGGGGALPGAAASPGEPTMLVPFQDTDDPLERPGELLTARTSNGIEYAVVSSEGSAAYLRGEGYEAAYTPRPFVDRVALSDGGKERVFQGAADAFDRPLVALDADLERMIVSRESVKDFPDSYLWTPDGSMENLTDNTDPFPEVTSSRRVDFSFTRRDGLEVQGRISMPVGWEEGDGPVPAIFWTYPREFETTEEYQHEAIERRNHHEFTHMSWLRWSDIWLTQGYALVYPDIPIIGENYNDVYISSLVDAMYGAIRAVDALGLVDIDRVGHGGHSYGAFATANILANSPFFKAGIAGDGAYNRSLTPTGFQAERRSIWEAPHTYIEMSPFFRADQINTPLLMYHGGDDDNTGTFPIQSRRMIHALRSLGKTAVLYEYPYESHTPRAIENKLDMWARFIDWFDTWVKDAGAPAEVISASGGGR